MSSSKTSENTNVMLILKNANYDRFSLHPPLKQKREMFKLCDQLENDINHLPSAVEIYLDYLIVNDVFAGFDVLKIIQKKIFFCIKYTSIEKRRQRD